MGWCGECCQVAWCAFQGVAFAFKKDRCCPLIVAAKGRRVGTENVLNYPAPVGCRQAWELSRVVQIRSVSGSSGPRVGFSDDGLLLACLHLASLGRGGPAEMPMAAEDHEHKQPGTAAGSVAVRCSSSKI